MTQVLEQKSKKKKEKKQWQKIIDEAKEELKKNDNTKKGIIRNTAKLLETNGMPLKMICGYISKEFHEFADGRYIRDCLDDKYKNRVMNRTQNAEATAANAGKNVLEDKPSQTSVGENLQSSQNHHNDTETTAGTEQLEEEIRPEDYNIADLPKYSIQLKDRIIIYLDGEVRRLREQDRG